MKLIADWVIHARCAGIAQVGHGLGTVREKEDWLSPFRFANWLPPFMFRPSGEAMKLKLADWVIAFCFAKPQFYRVLIGVIALRFAPQSRNLVAMGGLEPPTPAL